MVQWVVPSVLTSMAPAHLSADLLPALCPQTHSSSAPSQAGQFIINMALYGGATVSYEPVYPPGRLADWPRGVNQWSPSGIPQLGLHHESCVRFGGQRKVDQTLGDL